jgi:hypothetical protein
VLTIFPWKTSAPSSSLINMKTLTRYFTVGALLLASTAALKADPREAEDVAYRMATSYVAKGFSMAPTDNSGVLGGGQALRFLIPVTKGLDYVFLCGADGLASYYVLVGRRGAAKAGNPIGVTDGAGFNPPGDAAVAPPK